MRLLLEFLCRFGWGLALGLVATPAAVVPGGFFRVNLLVVMGLATFAALVAPTAAPGRTWLLPALAAVAAWMGSVAWFGERRRVGMVLSAACAAALAAAVGVLAAGPWAMASALVSGLVTGLTVHAMLLGHWYLNAPGMRVDALRWMIDLALAAWAAQVVVAVGGLLPWRPPADAATAALLSLRWLAGLVGLPVLLFMARRTLEIPNTQSATGILYVACLAAILGELTAHLLAAAA
jgi:hypothetical protein